uniref:Uncharacterized protein n=1 Tax=Arundo donax TaxID=35708 RepID=A0A0A9AQW8_ARUDO
MGLEVIGSNGFCDLCLPEVAKNTMACPKYVCHSIADSRKHFLYCAHDPFGCIFTTMRHTSS